jgi:hypothetical protein
MSGDERFGSPELHEYLAGIDDALSGSPNTVPYGGSDLFYRLAQIHETTRPGFRDRLRQRRRVGRPKGRLVSLGAIEWAYHKLQDESDKRPSQADVARRLVEPLDNVERALHDEPNFWRRLTSR